MRPPQVSYSFSSSSPTALHAVSLAMAPVVSQGGMGASASAAGSRAASSSQGGEASFHRQHTGLKSSVHSGFPEPPPLSYDRPTGGRGYEHVQSRLMGYIHEPRSHQSGSSMSPPSRGRAARTKPKATGVHEPTLSSGTGQAKASTQKRKVTSGQATPTIDNKTTAKGINSPARYTTRVQQLPIGNSKGMLHVKWGPENAQTGAPLENQPYLALLTVASEDGQRVSELMLHRQGPEKGVYAGTIRINLSPAVPVKIVIQGDCTSLEKTLREHTQEVADAIRHYHIASSTMVIRTPRARKASEPTMGESQQYTAGSAMESAAQSATETTPHRRQSLDDFSSPTDWKWKLVPTPGVRQRTSVTTSSSEVVKSAAPGGVDTKPAVSVLDAVRVLEGQRGSLDGKLASQTVTTTQWVTETSESVVETLKIIREEATGQADDKKAIGDDKNGKGIAFEIDF